MPLKFFKKNFALFLILLLATFLRFYRLSELMVFGGDVARDFLTARDITLKGQIPLVGCPSSVPWLHQGAFFIYLLGFVLWLGRYNPLAGGYFVGIFGVLGVLGVYLLGKKFFSEKAGLWAAFFYATSPLIVLFDRYPYHQSLISLFTIIFMFSLWKMMKNVKLVVLSFFLFGILMQLELSNLVLLPILLIWLYQYRKQINFKLLFFSFVAFLFTWLPKIIYDFQNGWTQTVGFIVWVIHKLPPVSNLIGEKGPGISFYEKLKIIFSALSRIIFWPSVEVSIGIFVLGCFFLLKGYLGEFREKKGSLKEKSISLLLLWIFIPFLGFLVHGAPSESYVPVLFGAIALLLGVVTESFLSWRFGKLALFSLIILSIFNFYFLLKNNFFVLTGKDTLASQKYNLGQSFYLNQEIAEFIVKDSGGKKFNLIPLGSFAHFSSSIMTLNYLCWYKGNEPSQEREKLQYFVYSKIAKTLSKVEEMKRCSEHAEGVHKADQNTTDVSPCVFYNKSENLKVTKADLVKEFPNFYIARKIRQ